MNLQAKMYDAVGNQMELKPDHVVVIGKESYCQIPLPQKVECHGLVYVEYGSDWERIFGKEKMNVLKAICEECDGKEI